MESCTFGASETTASHQSLRFRAGKGEEMELGKVERARVEPWNPQARAGKMDSSG